MKRLISFFASVRLTIVLLVLIAIVSVVGTFLPQHEEGATLAARLSPETARLLATLHVFDLYHSPLFVILMGLLSLNLIVCSLKRFPLSWKRIHSQPFPVPEELFHHSNPDEMISLTAKKEETIGAVEAILQKRFGKIAKERSVRDVVFFCQRGRYCHLGVYAVHISILMIIAGVVIGALFGFEGYITLSEGQSTQQVAVKGREESRALDFTVRCERFVLEFHENGMPKTYRSDLAFIRNGRIEQRGALLVNHPLSFGGLRFYQSNYGISPEGKARLAVSVADGKYRQITVTEGDLFELPERNATARIVRIEENMMNMGPAVNLRIASSKNDMSLWVFQHIEEIKRHNPGLFSNMPVLNPGLFQPYFFSLQRVEFPYLTGLQVMNDPGVPLVAAGGLLMICGLMMTFGIAHRRFWIRIDEFKGMTRIAVAGKSNRSSAGMAEEIRHLRDSIREGGKA